MIRYIEVLNVDSMRLTTLHEPALYDIDRASCIKGIDKKRSFRFTEFKNLSESHSGGASEFCGNICVINM